MANRIYSKGPYIHEEAVSGIAGIYPGMLLKRNSSGQVILHTTEGGALGDETLIAEEDALQGNTVDTVYTIGDIVSFMVIQPGTCFYGLIEDAQDIAISDKIMSAGNGKLKETTDLESGETLAKVVAVAIEAQDLTGSNSDDTITEMIGV